MVKYNISLSVVLPAHNEEENIENTVISCKDYLENVVFRYEIIVVNDGSKDNTLKILNDLRAINNSVKIVNHPQNLGYGAALRSGFDSAVNDFIFLMDSDGQFRIEEIHPFLQNVDLNTIVIGYRHNRADSFIRSLNKELYRMYIKAVFGLNVIDVDCAFKIFHLEAYKKIRPIKSGGALFSAELLIKFKRAGYRIIELPVNHYPRLYGEQSGANMRVIMRMFRESWQFRKELGFRK